MTNEPWGRAATRINRIQSGLRSVVRQDAAPARTRLSPPIRTSSWQEAPRSHRRTPGPKAATWRGDPGEAGQPFTSRHFLNAVDLETRPRRQPSARCPKTSAHLRAAVPAHALGKPRASPRCCLVIGYPIAHAIAHPRDRAGRRPCWCLCWCRSGRPLLVRTTAWIVLLQNQGVVNDILVALGIVADDETDRHDLQHDRKPSSP